MERFRYLSAIAPPGVWIIRRVYFLSNLGGTFTVFPKLLTPSGVRHTLSLSSFVMATQLNNVMGTQLDKLKEALIKCFRRVASA
jgi:hypothetical protein